MEKEFNITGTCIPEMHYMVDTSNKLDDVIKLIQKGKYFVINRPRQYGKTTTLYLLSKRLKSNENYLPIKISFEGIGDVVFEQEESFSKTFVQMLRRSPVLKQGDMTAFLEEQENKVQNLNDLSNFISNLVIKSNKKVVLMIDEVDKSSNNQLFLSFLGMLRNKYLLRNEGEDFTFHSVILAGVHNVKNLKMKIRTEDEQKYNSPWNIAADFDIDMSFSKEEIKTMLEDYVNSTEIKLDKEYFADRLYFYTSGYPFLVSKLCKIIDEKILPSASDSLEWKNEYIDRSVKLLLGETNTNFDSLIKNIENDSNLYELIKKIIIDGENITYVATDNIISRASMYGILRNENGICKVHNKIYEQLLYEHMTIKIMLSDFNSQISNYNFKEEFITSQGILDIKRILLKFQQFMKRERSEKLERFLENDGRLVFLAFLNPIINGTGFAFKETQISEEKRLDITITYGGQMNIIETKLWRGEAKHKQGLKQLWNYLNINNLDYGYLLIFDFRKEENRSKTVEEIELDGKKIFVVWV